MTAPSRIVDQLVIGGGPAGAMTAIKLAEAGRRVLLVEKQIGAHHKVCGEFLSREAIDYLHSIGVYPEDLGAAPIRVVRLSSGSRLAESALPFQALSLSRRVLDAALLARAARSGCEVLRGAAVESLTVNGSGWIAQLAGGESISARTVYLACGKHDLRGCSRTRGTQSDLVGFKLHWRLSPAQTAFLRDSIELFLFSGGYGGLALIEDEAANLCLVVRRSTLRRLGGWAALVAAILAENRHLCQRLSGAEALHARPLAISPIPYGYLNTRQGALWRVGDQAAVIPSFTGDGISIALHSGALAAQMYLNGRRAEEFACTLRNQLSGPMRVATWLSRAMVMAPARSVAPAILSLVPGMMRTIAAATRIPQSALVNPENALVHAGGELLEPASYSSRPGETPG